MSEQANMALRSILRQIEIGNCDTDFDRAYFCGQIAVIECYFNPDAQLLDQAKQALATLARKAA